MAERDRIALLICGTCKLKGIKAPAGATAGTKYTCSDCAKKISGSGFVAEDFWARPHRTVNPRIGRTEQAWWDRQGAAMRAGTKQIAEASRSEELSKIVNLLRRPNLKLRQAVRRKDRWTAGITAERIAALPEKQRKAFILVFLDDLTHREAAAFMNVSESAVNFNILSAKKKLASYKRPYLRKENISAPVTRERSEAVV